MTSLGLALQHLWVTKWVEREQYFRFLTLSKLLDKHRSEFIDALETENPLLKMLKTRKIVKRGKQPQEK